MGRNLFALKALPVQPLAVSLLAALTVFDAMVLIALIRRYGSWHGLLQSTRAMEGDAAMLFVLMTVATTASTVLGLVALGLLAAHLLRA